MLIRNVGIPVGDFDDACDVVGGGIFEVGDGDGDGDGDIDANNDESSLVPETPQTSSAKSSVWRMTVIPRAYLIDQGDELENMLK